MPDSKPNMFWVHFLRGQAAFSLFVTVWCAVTHELAFAILCWFFTLFMAYGSIKEKEAVDKEQKRES